MLYQKRDNAPTIPEQGNRGFQQQLPTGNHYPGQDPRPQDYRQINPHDPSTQYQPKPDSRPDFGRPDRQDSNRPDFNRPDRQDFNRPDLNRPAGQDFNRPDRPAPGPRPDARPDKTGDTPGSRPLTDMKSNDPSHPSPISLRPDQIQLKPGQDGLHGLTGKFQLEGGLPRNLDLKPSLQQLGAEGGRLPLFNLKAELNVKPFIDANRLELHSQLNNNLRMLPSEHLNQIYKTIGAQQGDFGIKPQQRIGVEGEHGASGNKPIDARLNPTEMSLAARQLALNPAGQQIASLLELMSRNQQLDRIPNADQSRLLMREFMQGMRLDQLANKDLTNQPLQIQRSLNQRDSENPNSLILKPQSLETARELLNLIKNNELVKLNDLVNKDPNRTLEINKAADAKVASILSDTKTNTLKTEKEEDLKALNAQKDIGKNQQQTLVVDRRLGAENKPDSQQVKQANTDSTQGGKSTHQEDKKGKRGDDKKDAQTDKTNQADLAILLANKLKELKDKEAKEKEKERAQEKGKKDPQQKTRLRYRIKERDTLDELASRFLHDSSLSPAIFHINRTVIPVIVHNGKTFASLPVNQMIWIPCDDDIESFKATGAAKQYEHIGFNGVQYASAEEELAARFGRRWFGPASAETPQPSKEQSRRLSNIQKILGDNTEDPVREPVRRPTLTAEERAARRANIEKVLGPFSPEPKDCKTRYTVRLGETLKSIALKHPMLNGVDAWRLLASINGLSTETNEKGAPLATLRRGMTLVIPDADELKAYRQSGILPSKPLDFTPIDEKSEVTISATIIEQSAVYHTLAGAKN